VSESIFVDKGSHMPVAEHMVVYDLCAREGCWIDQRRAELLPNLGDERGQAAAA
jgi:hypothetical protein